MQEEQKVTKQPDDEIRLEQKATELYDGLLEGLLSVDEEDEVMTAESIFNREMIAIALYKDSNINLGRALAMIMVEGVRNSQFAELDDLIEASKQTNHWFELLVKELDEGVSEEAKFANRCLSIACSAINMGTIVITSSEPSLQENSNFLARANDQLWTERGGWINWNVTLHDEEEMTESNAAHTVEHQWMAIVMHAVYNYGVDIEHAIVMAGLGQLGGDTPVTEKDSSFTQRQSERDRFDLVIEGTTITYPLEKTYNELQENQTSDAIFTNWCGHLSTDFMAREYQDCVNLSYQEENPAMKNPFIAKKLATGCSWFEMWIAYSKEFYKYDENFLAVLDYMAE